MFTFRYILLVVYCWAFGFSCAHAQDIDFSKCSCDSLFRYVFNGNNIKSYSDNYEGKKRYIEDDKCVTVTNSDSTIVIYESKKLWSFINDTNTLITITLKTDSIILNKRKGNHFSEVELYQRKVQELDVEYNFFKKDFGLELRLRILKNVTGNDSAFWYYSPKYYGTVTEANSNRIISIYALTVPIIHTLSIDTSGYLHGKHIAYCPNGEIMTVQTFSHGIKNGYFYYSNTCKLCEDMYDENQKKSERSCLEYSKGFFKNGEPTGKWIERLESSSEVFINEKVKCKRYVLKYGENNKTYLVKFFIYKKLIYNGLPPDSDSNSDLYYVIQSINLIFNRFYLSEEKRKTATDYEVIKMIKK